MIPCFSLPTQPQTMGSYGIGDLSGDNKDDLKAIAVAGMSVGFPGEITSPAISWNLLTEKETWLRELPKAERT